MSDMSRQVKIGDRLHMQWCHPDMTVVLVVDRSKKLVTIAWVDEGTGRTRSTKISFDNLAVEVRSICAHECGQERPHDFTAL